MFVFSKASNWRIKERVVVVLSRSTTAIGIREGSPALIIHIKIIMDNSGATNIPHIHILDEDIRIHSLLNMASIPVLELICYSLMISDIPGSTSIALSLNRAFTSKVFLSYCPVVLVAFHAAYDPRSLT